MNIQSMPNPSIDQTTGQFSDLASFKNGVDPELILAVQTGFIKTPKQLSSRFLDDTQGSRIFQEIMHSPEYFLTRSEYEILTTQKSELIRLFTGDS